MSKSVDDVAVLAVPGLAVTDETVAKVMHQVVGKKPVGVYKGKVMVSGKEVHWTYSYMGDRSQSELVFDVSEADSQANLKRLQQEALKDHVLS